MKGCSKTCGGTYEPYGIGGTDGTLRIYGSIDQKWRGTVGITGGTSGYTKDYDWNSEGAVITPPHFLAPGTASWAVGSSAISVPSTTPPVYPTS